MVCEKAVGPLEIWDISRGRKLVSIPAAALRQQEYVRPPGATTEENLPNKDIVISPDGRRILIAALMDFDNRLRLLDAASGRELTTLTGHTGQLTSFTFSSDGRRIVSASAREVKLWDAHTGVELFGFDTGTHYIAFSSDGRRLIAGPYGLDREWMGNIDATIIVWRGR